MTVKHVQSSAADTWTVDASAYLPFGGRARTVPAVVMETPPTTAAGAPRADAPYVQVEQGSAGAQAYLRWLTAVKGTAQVTVRCDNPI